MEKTSNAFTGHNPVVSSDVWLKARKDLLQKEKAFTRMRDQLSAERRALPWVKVEKTYVFDSPHGKKTLADLFDGRSQLFIKHFMLGPSWKEGCVGCSFGTDHIEPTRIHLEHHDVSVVLVARAPIAEIEAFRKRMGWQIRWVSSFDNDFNYDFHVSFTKEEVEKDEAFYNFDRRKIGGGGEAPGLSVFYKDEKGDIYHTYSAYARGDEEIISSYMILDMMPKGRNETGPGGNLGDWVKHHDKYDTAVAASCCHGEKEQTPSEARV